MKRKLILIASIAFLTGLTACSTPAGDNQNENELHQDHPMMRKGDTASHMQENDMDTSMQNQ